MDLSRAADLLEFEADCMLNAQRAGALKMSRGAQDDLLNVMRASVRTMREAARELDQWTAQSLLRDRLRRAHE